MGSYQIVRKSDQILGITFVGDVGLDEAEAYRDEVLGILSQANKPVAAIMYAAEVRRVSAKARRVFQGIGRHPMSGPTVILGTNRYLRIAASFVMRAVGKSDVRLMNDEEEALAWVTACLAEQEHWA